MASSARIDELRKKFDENPRRYFAPLANEYRKAGDSEQAIFICEEYLPQQPGHMSGHIVYGQALYELNRHEDARAVFETALSLDPENLIALRHLGDIARQGGDATTARMWYQRVLEADPRNEEIAQLMLSLLNDEQPAPAAAALSPTPLSNVVIEAQIADLAPPTVEPASDLEKSVDPPMPAAPPVPLYDEARHVSPHAPKESDLLDLDDFDLGGVPLSELRAAGGTPVYQPAQPFDPSEPFDESKASGIAMPEMIDHGDTHHDTHHVERDTNDDPSHDARSEAGADNHFEVGLGAEPSSLFEADPFSNSTGEIEKEDDRPIGASSESNIEPFVESSISTSYSDNSYRDIADVTVDETGPADLGVESTFESAFEPGLASAFTAPPEPTVDSAADLHLGLTDDGTAQPTVGDESDTAASTMADLETFEAGVFSAAPTESQLLETEPFFETPLVSDEPPGSYVASELAREELVDESKMADATEFDLSVADAAAVASVADQADSEAQVSDADGLDFQGESFGAPESIESIEIVESIETVEFEQAVDSGAASDQASQPTELAPTFDNFDNIEDEASEAPAVEVFVTETMAQLYLEQGHLESALGIYRRLVEQRPDDEDLAARMDAIEERVAATSIESDEEGMYVDESLVQLAADLVPAQSHGGPTIREFLNGLVTRVPGDAALFEPLMETQQPASVNDADDYASEAFETPLDDFGELATESAQYGEAPADEMLSGSLDVLFSGAAATDSDATAAETLAQAFATEMPAGSAPESALDEASETVAAVSSAPVAATSEALEGQPAHRASDELSLDHVFKTNNAPRATAGSDGFSFDQFFSDEVAEGAAETGVESSAPAPQGADDIAQFNAWLNGLKKS